MTITPSDVLAGNAIAAAVIARNAMRAETQAMLADEIATARDEMAARVQALAVAELDAEDLSGFSVLTDEELERLADSDDYDQVNRDIVAWYDENPLEAAMFFGDYASAYDSELFATFDDYQRELDDRYDDVLHYDF